MLVQTSQGQSGSAHVVVLGNEKGGSGKSTTALHIAVALMKAGQRVATIDLDCRQQSFTRYINNRSAWARRTGLKLELPTHYCIELGLGEPVAIKGIHNFRWHDGIQDIYSHRPHDVGDLVHPAVFVLQELHFEAGVLRDTIAEPWREVVVPDDG